MKRIMYKLKLLLKEFLPNRSRINETNVSLPETISWIGLHVQEFLLSRPIVLNCHSVSARKLD